MTTIPKDTEKIAALGRMSRGLVHDFNNSLASIMGYAEFLAADLDPDSEQHLFATNIRRAGVQIQDLLDQIRALSLEKGQSKDIRLNLVEDIRHIEDRFRQVIPKYHNITITSDIDEAIISIPPHQVRTLFSNLIKNAVEALPQHDMGQVTLHITQGNHPPKDTTEYTHTTTLLTAENGTMPIIRIDISDTGCGMDDVILGLAAEPHFTTKATGDSHGMGIPVVYGIVNYLEGGLSISSTPQKGTRVTITLPVEKIIDKISPTTEDKKDGKTILLVEDRDMLRHTIETMIKRDGHNVISAADGLSALDTLRENPRGIDILMTDFTMPTLNGKDLLTEVRADFPNLPVIIISGDLGHLGAIENDPTLKNVFVLPKPVSPNNLKNLIKSATSRQ